MERLGTECSGKTAEPATEKTCHYGWRGLLGTDYDRAVIRLAVAWRGSEMRLLFAWVELLPPEIPAPPSEPYAHKTFGGVRLAFCRVVMPLAEAIAWYEAAWAGTITKPGEHHLVQAEQLVPEPPARRFVLRREALPFSPNWHLTPRLHQLVAASDPAGLVADLTAGMIKSDAFSRGRVWLKEHLHFDVLAHDVWLGSVVLVAPNPLMRAVGERLADRDATSETVEVVVQARRGQDLSGLTVTFEERRADAEGHYQVVQMGADGHLRVRFEGLVAEHAVAIACPGRGLLHRSAQTSFFREVRTYWVPPPVTKEVTVPRRKVDGTELTQLAMVSPRRDPEPETPVSGLHRLMTLEERQRRRFGELRPLSNDQEVRDTLIFHADRGHAVAEIQRLIGRAEERVIFVDPFFSPPDLLEFATQVRREGIAIGMLVGRNVTKPDKPPPGLPAELTAEEWFEQVAAELANDSLLKPAQIDLKVFADGQPFHDRFLVVDREVWFCGHSFNAVGDGRYSVMTRLERPDQMLALILEQMAQAQTYADWRAGRAE